MGKLILGGVLLFIAFFMMVARAGSSAPRSSGLLRLFALVFTTLAGLLILGALVVVIEPGQVGVKHAFGTVDMKPLLPGIHMVPPGPRSSATPRARSSIPGSETRSRPSPRSRASRWE